MGWIHQDISPPIITLFQHFSSGDISAEGHRSIALGKVIWFSSLNPLCLSCVWVSHG